MKAPRGESAWLQAGIAAFPQVGLRLYVEEVSRGHARRFADLGPAVVGRRYRVRVVETSRDVWRAFLNEHRVGEAAYLPTTGGSWRPVVTAESWAAGHATCNRYAYRFEAVSTLHSGRWAALAARRCGLLTAIVLCLAIALPASAEDDGPRLVGPFTRADYPQALIDRPLTLPAGMVEAELGGSFVSQRFQLNTSVLSGVGGTDDWNLDLMLRVGITDRLQVEAGTAFSLDHTLRLTSGFEGVGPIDLRPSLTSWQRWRSSSPRHTRCCDRWRTRRGGWWRRPRRRASTSSATRAAA